MANIFEILSDKKGRFLLGYPVEFVSCMPSTEANDQICAILGELELGAMLGERRELNIAKSDDVFFGNDQIAIRGIERIDIAVYGVGDTTDAGALAASGGNPALAATLVEQVTTMALGGREKPRQAMEKALGVKWENLSIDQRSAALLQYVGSIPESRRAQVLVGSGFEPQMATEIGKMISPTTQEAMAKTSYQVSRR